MITKTSASVRRRNLHVDEATAFCRYRRPLLAVMSPALPPQLRQLANDQRGVVSRSQVLAVGLTKDLIASRLKLGSWQQLHPGVYAVFSGELSREAELWAAVLYAGSGATLSHQTAAELWKLTDETSSLIHVTIPADRRVRQQAGLAVHLSSRARQSVHPSRNPPRTRLEDTVIDLWQAARNLDSAVGWLTTAIGRRLSTQDKLRETMAARSRIRWRQQLAELLSPDAAGIHSVLEYRYVRDVERPHGLAGADRQVRITRNSRNEYRDQYYAKYRTIIELDGRVAHPGDTRWNDIRRDNAAATAGDTTLRYGWREVTITACTTAAEVATVLSGRGYAAAHPCSDDCPVPRGPANSPAAKPGQNAGSRRRVPVRSGRRAARARLAPVTTRSSH
jgi:very-short-patch-repair endonuclease